MVDQVTDAPRTRRAVLVAAAAAGAAAVVTAVAKPVPALAGADDNADMFVGIQYGDVEATTGLVNSKGNATVFYGTNTHAGTGVQGNSSTGMGVYGTANGGGTGIGVKGISSSGRGVVGESTSSYGVNATSGSGHALWAESTSGYGVYAKSSAGAGLVAVSTSSYGAVINTSAALPAVLAYGGAGSGGVHGHAGNNPPATVANTGVEGSAEGSGTGGYFSSPSGHALRVVGRASFTRAGRASIPKNRAYVDVTVAGGLSATAAIVATLQVQRGTCSVTSVRTNYPTAGKARIYLNKVASTTASTPVGFFVIG
jgi:hypothetical protein